MMATAPLVMETLSTVAIVQVEGATATLNMEALFTEAQDTALRSMVGPSTVMTAIVRRVMGIPCMGMTATRLHAMEIPPTAVIQIHTAATRVRSIVPRGTVRLTALILTVDKSAG